MMITISVLPMRGPRVARGTKNWEKLPCSREVCDTLFCWHTSVTLFHAGVEV